MDDEAARALWDREAETFAGLAASESVALVEQLGGHSELRTLDDPALWGGPIVDERYLLVCTPVTSTDERTAPPCGG